VSPSTFFCGKSVRCAIDLRRSSMGCIVHTDRHLTDTEDRDTKPPDREQRPIKMAASGAQTITSQQSSSSHTSQIALQSEGVSATVKAIATRTVLRKGHFQCPPPRREDGMCLSACSVAPTKLRRRGQRLRQASHDISPPHLGGGSRDKHCFKRQRRLVTTNQRELYRRV